MTPKDAFGVVVRTFGLALLLCGWFWLLSALYVALTPAAPHAAPPVWAVVYGVFSAATGLYLLRGAPGLLRFAYPETVPPNAVGPASQHNSWYDAG